MALDPSIDPVALDPDKFDVRLENDRVRVLETNIAPGCGHGMHWHPDHLIYILSSYKVEDSFSDGETKVIERDAGDILWGEELTHATKNVGETPVRALIIELKGDTR